MKKHLILSLITFVIMQATGFGQTGNYIKRPALGINFFFDDFKGAAYVRQNGFATAIKDKQLTKFSQMNAGFGLNYMTGISNHLDFAAGLGGTFLDYPFPNRSSVGSNNLLLEADASVRAKMFSDKYFLSPFLSAGIGASKYLGYYGAFVPVGVGVQVNFFDDAFLVLHSQYRIAVPENSEFHFYHSVGIAGNIGKPKKPKPVAVPVIPAQEAPRDKDGDGIVDSLDACPDVAGLARYQGCPIPDRDKDGINDEDDKCPDTPGLARYQGCPIPDRDKDGINDEEDKCPDVPGVARYQGCPVPDRDKDGINDEEDKCPDVPGVAENSGCPVIKAELIKKMEFAAKNIYFNANRYVLLPKSIKPLTEAAKILKENKDLKLSVDGYTDNSGKPNANQVLSQHRAEAVKNFLVSKGVEADRISAAGHGQDNPRSTNKTLEGRAKNRRVELLLKYY